MEIGAIRNDLERELRAMGWPLGRISLRLPRVIAANSRNAAQQATTWGADPDRVRFLPNVVVDGTQPFDEDTWKRIRIGAAEFACFSPCARCVLTTVDPATGTVDKSGEPLRTLAQYRRNEGGVMFGMNLIPTALSTLCLLYTSPSPRDVEESRMPSSA